MAVSLLQDVLVTLEQRPTCHRESILLAEIVADSDEGEIDIDCSRKNVVVAEFDVAPCPRVPGTFYHYDHLLPAQGVLYSALL